MTGLELFLVFVGVTTLTEKVMKLIVYLDRPRGRRSGYDAR